MPSPAATLSCSAPCSPSSSPTRVAPDDEAAARLGAFGSEQVARVVELQLARLPDGAAPLARAVAVLGPGAALRHAARLAPLELAAAARAADALRAAGLLEHGPGLTLAHPLIAGTLYTSLPAGERALRHADAAALLASERADPERIGLHLLRTEPAREAATVATLREAARRASGRGAPRRARRRTCAARSPSRRPAPRKTQTSGSSLASRSPRTCSPTPTTCCTRRSPAAVTPVQRGTIALNGARALGLSGRFDPAFALCRQALEQAGAYPPELRERLEAELIATAWCRCRRSRRRAAMCASTAGTFGARAVAGYGGLPGDVREPLGGQTMALLRPALEQGVLAAEPGSLCGSVTTVTLIAR